MWICLIEAKNGLLSLKYHTNIKSIKFFVYKTKEKCAAENTFHRKSVDHPAKIQ